MFDNNIILKALQNYPENKLTKEIIIPTLEKMGYSKVYWNGGTNEFGKDIIMWKYNNFKRKEVSVAQVKHFELNNNSRSNKSFGNIKNQLIQCFTEEIKDTDGNNYIPSQAVLISTYPLPHSKIKDELKKSIQLKLQNIEIIDGNDLIELIKEFYPDSLTNLLGVDYDISNKLCPKFSQDTFYDAIKSNIKKDIKIIFTDVDFSLGAKSTRLFFNSDFKIEVENNKKIKMHYEEWKILKRICKEINSEFEINFIENGIDEIDKRYNKQESQYISKVINLKNLEVEISKKKVNHLKNITKIKELQLKLKKDKNNYNTLNTEIKELELQNILFDKDILKLNSEKDLITNQNKNFLISIKIHGKQISKQLIDKKNWIETNISKFNEKKHSASDLKIFFEKVDTILNSSSKILNFKNIEFQEKIGIKKINDLRESFENVRFRMPLKSILNTGINICLVGDAGAGKSTNLEMYAFENSQNKIPILIYLGQSIKNFISNNENIEDDDFIENLILNHLNSEIKLNWNKLQLFEFIKNKKPFFLFDGLDEAVGIKPNLSLLINKFSKKYYNSQIVVSTRFNSDEIEKVSLFTITLLPFTDAQRIEFLKKWFKDNKFIYEKVINHINNNNNIGDIVRNPLLISVFCVLAENNLPLPTTEIKLYEERLNLMLGQYDSYKKIPTRIFSSYAVLKKIAQKIAFYLHQNNTRQMPLIELKSYIIKELKYDDELNLEKITLGLEELIYPCEILVPMVETGNYGLGHLRYQEFLVSEELVYKINTDKSFKILEKLHPKYKKWWFTPIRFYLSKNNCYKWFFELVINEKNVIDDFIVELRKNISSKQKSNFEGYIEQYNIQVKNIIPFDKSLRDFE